MKTTQLLEERRVDNPTPQLDATELEKVARNPRKAALLSLLPGLGQLYNGETSKGVLFLLVSAFSLGFVGLAASSPFILEQLPKFGLKPNEEIVYILNQAHTTHNLCLWVGMFVVFALYAGRDAFDNAVKSRKGAHYAKYFFGLPESSSGSYIIHMSALLVMICVAVASIAFQPPPQTTEIEFVLDPPKEEPPPPPPPKEKPLPKPKKSLPKLIEPKKSSPPKAAPKVIAPPTPVVPDLPRTDAPSPITAPAGPPDPGPVATNPGTGGTGGSNAGGGGGGGDGQDVDLSAYLAEMERRIKAKWYPPKGNESKKIVVSFKLNSQGRVSKIRLISSSRLAIADDAATTAIQDGSPFGPLPDGAPDVVSIRFTFDYDVFSGRASLSR